MLHPGDILGPYEIRAFVGQGGMGAVYRAFDPRLERTVALKVIAATADPEIPEASTRIEGRVDARGPSPFAPFAPLGGASGHVGHARLLREARAVAALSHPNVVAIYDVGESAGNLYLAMEYVVGRSLRALIVPSPRGPGPLEADPSSSTSSTDVPLPARIGWLVDIARALDAAHRVGLVHRDVKPENVMVRDDGVVKVLDFGIARRMQQVTVGENTGSQALPIDLNTGSGGIAGTPVYMSPEQIRGDEVDARTDQFAWGVLAYELLAGRRPWNDSKDMLELVAKLLTEPPRSLAVDAPEVPRAVDLAIARALEKEPAARFASMGDVADALLPFAAQDTGRARGATLVEQRGQVHVTPASTRGAEGQAVPSASGPRSDAPEAFAATTRAPLIAGLGNEAEGGATGRASSASEQARRAGRPLRKRIAVVAGVLVLGIGVFAGRNWPSASSAPFARRAPAKVATPEPPRPLSDVPEAESEYKQALSLWRDGATAKATAALERATKLDPTFAAAHLALAVDRASLDPTLAQAAFQRAFEHRQFLTARDAAFLEANVPYVRANPDLEEWATRLTAMVFQFPKDATLRYYLGVANERVGDDLAARDSFAAAVGLDEGFVPGLAALANVAMNLGDAKEALSATERCLSKSPIASTCTETRYDLFASTGECHAARLEATNWVALEPDAPRPAGALARALFADKAPRPAVEEALARKWSVTPVETRTRVELIDRVQLAVVDGDLAEAAATAQRFDAALPLSADRSDRAVPARLRVNFLMEMDRLGDAAKVARAYLDKQEAWQAYPFGPDPAIDFYEPLARAGEITAAELEEHRDAWIARERKRVGTKDQDAAWAIWTGVYGGFTETREEANAALAHRPREPLPAGLRRPLVFDFALGKTLVLANKAEEGIGHLERVIHSCAALDSSLLTMRSRYYLGLAYEARGELAHARASYEALLEGWKGPATRTTRAASERLANLAR